jgi:hypothetical protein
MSFPLEEPSVLTSSRVEEGRVEGILLPKKRELTIPPAPFDEGGVIQGLRMKSIKFGNILIYK